MKKGKIVFVSLVFMLAGSIGIFAQENGGYIKPTWSLGFVSATVEGYSEALAAIALDVDFINSFGLTFGLQPIMAWNGDGTFGMTNLGIGYTYTADKWSAGGKLMAVPFSEFGGGLGLDANGTYWFMEALGVTGILNLSFGLGDINWTIFSIRIGISAKF
jgi:hypothetical protein